MTNDDHRRPPGAPAFQPARLAVREEQARFVAGGTARGGMDGVLQHGEAAVDGLAGMITAAVRADDDDHVTDLDRVLREVEQVVAIAKGRIG